MLDKLEVRGIEDPYRAPAAADWQIVDASELTKDLSIETDVVIVGTGSGGATTAEVLSSAGLRVVLLEEGPLKSSDQFNMVEREGLTDLYQDGGLRTSADGNIVLAQGRNVGGGTTVNWCSTFRTPAPTLAHWARDFGLKGMSEDELAPHFEAMEARLNVAKWVAPNPNNAVLSRGAEALGIHWDAIPRNVSGCWNLGYCGFGCPVDAKKSMLVTSIPEALRNGAQLIHRAQVQQLTVTGETVQGVVARAMKSNGRTPSGPQISVKARHTVLSGGAINTPGVLLRSNVPDPFGRIGRRTFLHPVVTSIGHFEEAIDPYYGAPQSTYSDEFTWADGVNGRCGYKLEVLPLTPGIFATLLPGHGAQLMQDVERLSQTNALMAFLRDGFNDESPGGTVSLGKGGTPVLDYQLTDYLRDGIRRALTSMMEVQLAAGAGQVRPMHVDGRWVRTVSEMKDAVADLSMEAGRVSLSSAHLMGGCAMGEDQQRCPVDSTGRYRYLQGLSIHDGSLFPTGLGANPQMSIFGITHRLSQALANDLKSAADVASA